MWSVKMTVVHCRMRSPLAMTRGYGMSRRSPYLCTARVSSQFPPRRPLMRPAGSSRQLSRRLQHLNISAIAAPELGTPDAIAGTVSSTDSSILFQFLAGRHAQRASSRLWLQRIYIYMWQCSCSQTFSIQAAPLPWQHLCSRFAGSRGPRQVPEH